MNTIILIIGFGVLIKVVYDGLEKIGEWLINIFNTLRRIEDGPRKFY